MDRRGEHEEPNARRRPICKDRQVAGGSVPDHAGPRRGVSGAVGQAQASRRAEGIRGATEGEGRGPRAECAAREHGQWAACSAADGVADAHSLEVGAQPLRGRPQPDPQPTASVP